MITQRQIIRTLTSSAEEEPIVVTLIRLRERGSPPLRRDQLRQIVMENGSNEVIIAAIETGDLSVLTELKEGYGVEGDDFRENSVESIRVIATQDEDYDYVNVLRVLRDEFDFDVDDVRESGSITVAASVGNVIFLRALREVFGITDDDVRSENNSALVSAASGNSAFFLRELRNVYGLSTEDAREGDNQALISAASSGNAEALRELLFGFGLTSEDASARNNQALADAVENRNNEIVLILLYGFGLTRRDIESRSQFAMRNAVRSRNQELVRMLRRYQSLELSEDERRIQRDEILEDYLADVRADEGGDSFEEGEERQAGAAAAPVIVDPREIVATETETIAFNISPPLKIDYDYEAGTCFDFIAFDEVVAREYLEEDDDNIIMVNVSEGKALCFTKSRLREIASDPSERFIECIGPIVDESIGEKSQRWIPENPPLFVKIPSNPESGSNAFIPYENLNEAVESRERIFCLVPLLLGDGSGIQASFTHTITEKNWRQLIGFSYVSSNHCQRGSNILLYKFVKCRFTDGPGGEARRAPKWSLEPK